MVSLILKFLIALLESPLLGWLLKVIPPLRRLATREGAKKIIAPYLATACRAIAQATGVSEQDVRSNIFTPDRRGVLKIVRGLHYNMDDRPVELGIEIPKGYGASGSAFEQGVAVVARAKGGWGKHTLSEKQMRKAHPDLKWILSFPLAKPNGGGEIVGVFNVDCLREDRTKGQLRPAIDEMAYWAKRIVDAMAISRGAWFS